MSDFLSNLMARSFADAPAIQPRLPSLFEAGAAGPLAESQLFSEPPTAAKAAGTVDAFRPLLAQNVSISSESGPASVQQPLNHSPSDKHFQATTATRPIPEQFQAQTFWETDAIQPMAPPAPSSESARQYPSPATRPPPPSPVGNHFSETNRAARRRMPSAQFEQPSPRTAPTINVTIGRVEVRAIQSPASASKPAKPAKPAPPKLSLDDYLQKRDGGAR